MGKLKMLINDFISKAIVNRNRHFFITVLLGMLVASSAAFAEVNIDYGNFKSTRAELTNLEIYCQFTNDDIHFTRSSYGYEAEVELTMVVYNSRGEYIDEISTTQKIVATKYEMTNDRSKANLVQYDFNLKPGNYKLKFLMTGKNTHITLEEFVEVQVRSFEQRSLDLSDINVAAKIESSDPNSNLAKNGKKITPNPSRIFDASAASAHFYFEVYNLDCNAKNSRNEFSLHYRVKDEFENILKDFSTIFSKSDVNSAINFSVAVNKLKRGKLKLEVEVFDLDAKQKAENSTYFYVNGAMLALDQKDYGELLDMIHVIAKNREYKQLKKVSYEERQRAIYSFWKSKDPTPGTENNEFMDEFFSRILYANNKFTHSGMKGWKTDRGKIFVKYGSPDSIRRSLPKDRYQYEIWEYRNSNQTFVFIDRHGFGDYILVKEPALRF